MYISVVIPLYNKEKYIQRAVISVLQQTYQCFEILVINDGSTDNSVSKVKELNDERIRIISQENAGVSAARNIGIKESSYQIVAFLDADDEWLPNYLETLNHLVVNYPDAGIYGLAYEFKRPNGTREPAIYHNLSENNWEGYIEDYFESSIKNQLLWSSAVAVPKKVFENVGYFSEGMTRGEDLEMWLKIVSKYKVAFSNTIASIYHQDAENRACNSNVIYTKSFISKVEDYYEDNLINFKDSKYYKEYMIRIFITKAKYLISVGKRKEARKLLKKYKETKYFKKPLYLVYLSSYLPGTINDKLYELRNKIKL